MYLSYVKNTSKKYQLNAISSRQVIQLDNVSQMLKRDYGLIIYARVI